MLPELPRDLYRHPGPFASVYLDVSRGHQGAPHEIELRWKELASSLHEQGADAETVTAIERVVTEPTGEPGPTGRAVIAAAGRVRFDVALPEPPRREIARWAPLPHLMPLLAQAPDPLPHVVVELGKTSATVLGFDAGRRATSRTGERGQRDDTHKTGGGGWAHYGMQRRTEELWRDNLRGFASSIEETVARLHAELLVLTGDVQARSMLLDELSSRSREIAVEVAGASPDDETTDEGIGQQVRQLVAQRAAQRTREVLDRVATATGRDAGLAAIGLREVLPALQRGQVEVLVVVDDPSSTLEVWVGREPGQLAESETGLAELGAEVLGRDRADAALVRAAAGTGADLVVLPHPRAGTDPDRAGSAAGAQGAGPGAEEIPELVDGVGALLRFSTPA